jgi:hypothetical protein
MSERRAKNCHHVADEDENRFVLAFRAVVIISSSTALSLPHTSLTASNSIILLTMSTFAAPGTYLQELVLATATTDQKIACVSCCA